MHFSNLLLAALPLLAPEVVAGPHTARAGRHHAMAREAREALVAREASGSNGHFGFPPSSLNGIAGMKRDAELDERDPANAHLGFAPSSGNLDGIAGVFKRDIEERQPANAHLGFSPSSGKLDGIAGISKREMEERDPAKAHLGFSPSSLDGIAGMSRRSRHKKIRKRKTTCKAKTTASASASSATASAASASANSSTAIAATTTESQASSSTSKSASLSSTKSAASASSDYASESTAYSSASATGYSSASATGYASASASSADGSASSTATSAAASATASSSSSDGSIVDNLFAAFFPIGTGSARWSTVVSWTGYLSFTSALNPLTSGKLPSSTTAPDGSTAMIANYPAGTYKYSSSTGHGYSFYSPGSADSVDITGAKEALFSYSVYFPSGFDFVKGGKLPGLYGGSSLENAKSCSGGRSDGRDECFSARLMWRADGAGEIYNYLPPDYWTDAYCSTSPYSKCDSTYGESIGRGAFTFATGDWTTVAMRVKLNDYGSTNGEQQLYVNGKSVISLSNLTISANSETKMYGIMAQTFFGGSDSSWASPSDQSAYFKDWTLAILE